MSKELDLLEELLSVTEPLEPQMSNAQRKAWTRISAECADIREVVPKEGIVTDEKLDQSIREAEVFIKISQVLKNVEPEKRLRVLRASSILTLGMDLHELAGRKDGRP